MYSIIKYQFEKYCVRGKEDRINIMVMGIWSFIILDFVLMVCYQ